MRAKVFHAVELSEIFDSIRSNKTVVYYLDKVTKEYPKLFALCTIPAYAIISRMLFARARHNFAEHLVINSYRAAGELLVSLTFTLAMVVVPKPEILRTINFFYTILYITYSTIFYYQYFSTFGYSRKGLFFRSFLASIALVFILGIMTAALMIMAGD